MTNLENPQQYCFFKKKVCFCCLPFPQNNVCYIYHFSLNSNVQSVKVRVYDVFSRKKPGNCLILKIHSFVFELSIYMCTYNQYYCAHFQLKCRQYSGSVLNVFIDDFTSLLRLPYSCYQKIRSVPYSCRKTSVRNCEAVRRPWMVIVHFEGNRKLAMARIQFISILLYRTSQKSRNSYCE